LEVAPVMVGYVDATIVEEVAVAETVVPVAATTVK
jgi:hypothetical protein